MGLADRLNLSLAWDRVKEDFKSRAFVDQPFLVDLIEEDKGEWLENIRKSIREDRYNPSDAKIINVPKKDWNVRTGKIINVNDLIIYNALVLDFVESIYKNIIWSQERIRFSSLLREDQSGKEWFYREKGGWSGFREHVIERLEEADKNFSLFADISSYFENIEIKCLIDSLKEVGCEEDSVGLISTLLNRWAEPLQKGVPQGLRPSFVLAELYLNELDLELKRSGIEYARYVDDIYIFCETKNDAIKSQIKLTDSLRRIGLNLQTSKTKIQTAKMAKKDFVEISQKIEELKEEVVNHHRIKEEFEDLDDEDDGYQSSPPDEPDSIFELDEEEREEYINKEALKMAFDENIHKKTKSFDKTIFHFVLNRLGDAKEPYRINYCLRVIKDRPEETEYVLNYIKRVGHINDKNLNWLVSFCESDDLIYDYQLFLILRWVFRNVGYHEGFVIFSDYLVNEFTRPMYVLAYAISIIGIMGDPNYIRDVYKLYPDIGFEEYKATIVVSKPKGHPLPLGVRTRVVVPLPGA